MISYTLDDDKKLDENLGADITTVRQKTDEIFNTMDNNGEPGYCNYDLLREAFKKLSPEELHLIGCFALQQECESFFQKKQFEKQINEIEAKINIPKYIIFYKLAKYKLSKILNSVFVWRCLTTALAIKIYLSYWGI